MRIGKHHHSKQSYEEEKSQLTKVVSSEYGSTLTMGSPGDILLTIDDIQLSPALTEAGFSPSSQSQIDAAAPYSITTPVCVDKLQEARENVPNLLKPQDFQVFDSIHYHYSCISSFYEYS